MRAFADVVARRMSLRGGCRCEPVVTPRRLSFLLSHLSFLLSHLSFLLSHLSFRVERGIQGVRLFYPIRPLVRFLTALRCVRNDILAVCAAFGMTVLGFRAAFGMTVLGFRASHSCFRAYHSYSHACHSEWSEESRVSVYSTRFACRVRFLTALRCVRNDILAVCAAFGMTVLGFRAPFGMTVLGFRASHFYFRACHSYSHACHSEWSEESRVSVYSTRFACRLRFLTALRCVRNDILAVCAAFGMTFWRSVLRSE